MRGLSHTIREKASGCSEIIHNDCLCGTLQGVLGFMIEIYAWSSVLVEEEAIIFRSEWQQPGRK